MRKVAALLLCLAACSRGRNITEPSVPLDTSALSVYSVDGAFVAFDLQQDGNAVLISSANTLTLRTFRRSGAVYLWPNDDRVSLSYTRYMVYGNNDQNLRRLAYTVRSVALMADQNIRKNPGAYDALIRGAQLFSLRNETVLYLVDAQGADLNVAVSINARDKVFQNRSDAAAVASLKLDSHGTITEARIAIRTLEEWHGWDNFMVAMAHEIAHVHGLLHLDPTGPQGIMSETSEAYRYRDFTQAEQLVLTMHDRRPAGTRLRGVVEDETGGVQGLSREEGVWITVID